MVAGLSLLVAASAADGASFRALGDLPGGFFDSAAYGISADGSVVVGAGSSASGTEAFRWTQAGGMVGLGDLPGGAFFSQASDVSADGSVVVGYGQTASGPAAFRWTQAEGMVGLGDLPGGSFESLALGVSADGSVVVGVGNSVSGNEAFLWTQAGGMVSIRDLLAGQGVDLTGWTLDQAQAVSADGRFVVGVGTNPSGDSEAWLADLQAQPVPEAHHLLAAALPALAGLGWARRRLRRQA